MTDNTQPVSSKVIDRAGWLAAILFVFGMIVIIMSIKLDHPEAMMAGFVSLFAGTMGGAVHRALKAISHH